MTLCLGDRLGLPLEFLRERDVVEEDIRVVKLVVPCTLEILHCAKQVVQFLVTDKRNEGGIGAVRLCTVGGIIVVFGTP